VIDWSEALLAAKLELRDAEGELTSTPPGRENHNGAMAVAHLKQAITYLQDVVQFVERK
jgi:hypothetical protein